MRSVLLVVACLAGLVSFAAKIVDDEWTWYDGERLPLEGRAFPTERLEHRFDRLPASAHGKVREAVWNLSRTATGFTLRFTATSDKVAVKWSLENAGKAWLDDLYMTPFVQGGVDYYVKAPGSDTWTYGTKLGPSSEGVCEGVCDNLIPGGEVIVNLPVRGILSDLRLGLPKAKELAPAAPHKLSAKPVVIYGTSIVHGGCVSRPGLLFTSQAARELDVEVVNLGFSGNATMEREVLDVMAEIDASCYVVDCLWNMSPELVRERAEPFFRELRRRRPGVPIVFVEDCSADHAEMERGLVLREVFDKLFREGWDNIYLLHTADQMPVAQDLTLDHCHPNDAGARYMSAAYVKAIRSCFSNVPEAPSDYRRPADWRPNRYPKTLATLAKDHAAEMEKRAAEAMRAFDAVNEKGPWKGTAESLRAHACPEWFGDVKFGIFIDWGLWSLASWCPYQPDARLYPDWYELRMNSNFLPVEPFFGMRDYHVKNWGADFTRDDFIPLFQARKFDAEHLLDVAQACGARYVVPFLKHHSGFSLWDSSYTFRDSVDRGPHRDVAREVKDACERRGMKFGFYFSLAEWEYPMLKEDGSLDMLVHTTVNGRVPYEPKYETLASGKVAVRDYVRGYSLPQAKEFIDRYRPDILWYDIEWVDTPESLGSLDLAAYFYNVNEGIREVAVNDRFGLDPTRKHNIRTTIGDFYTDECGDTTALIKASDGHAWELNRGISKSFGNHWQDDDARVMSERELICSFIDCIARGGNMLLLVNLDGQGALPAIQETRLRQLGRWISAYKEAIYPTRAVTPYKTDDAGYMATKDGSVVYALVKRPAAELVIPRTFPEGTAFAVLGGPELQAVASAGRTVVFLPPAWAGAELPFVIKCSRRIP